MSRQQLIAIGILGLAVITVYVLGIVMAADVLRLVQVKAAEPPGGPVPQETASSAYPPTWTPTFTPTPRSTDTPIPTWTPGPTHTPTLTPTVWPTDTPAPAPTDTPPAPKPPAPPPVSAPPTRAPTPTAGRLVFEADDNALVAGECTTLFWIADDARSVELDGDDVDWQGSKEVCPSKTKTYELEVKLNTGKEVDLEKFLSNLFYYVVMLWVMLLTLDVLGVEGVLDP